MAAMVGMLMTVKGGDLDNAKKIAKQFIESADVQNADLMRESMHENCQQFIQLDGKLMITPIAEYVQLIADKKLGGKPRKIDFRKAEILRGGTASVIINATSDEYDFYYQVSLAKVGGKWVIVNILGDIQKVND